MGADSRRMCALWLSLLVAGLRGGDAEWLAQQRPGSSVVDGQEWLRFGFLDAPPPRVVHISPNPRPAEPARVRPTVPPKVPKVPLVHVTDEVEVGEDEEGGEPHVKEPARWPQLGELLKLGLPRLSLKGKRRKILYVEEVAEDRRPPPPRPRRPKPPPDGHAAESPALLQ